MALFFHKSTSAELGHEVIRDWMMIPVMEEEPG